MNLWMRLTDALFPVACLGCAAQLQGSAARIGPLCAACRAATVPPPPPLCERCGVPLGSRRPDAPRDCLPCRQHAPAFATARGAALYDATAPEAPLGVAIHALKYHGNRALAPALAHLMTSRLPVPPDALVVPVPLHPARLRERRFNQAALIALAVGRQCGLPVGVRALVRTTPGPTQTELGAAARRQNLRGAFATWNPALVRGRKVLLVDDVITTGATVDACARALLDAGARRVDAYAAGRTPRARA